MTARTTLDVCFSIQARLVTGWCWRIHPASISSALSRLHLLGSRRRACRAAASQTRPIGSGEYPATRRPSLGIDVALGPSATALRRAPESVAERWAALVLKTLHAEHHPRTIASWARAVGVSRPVLCEYCRLVHVSPRERLRPRASRYPARRRSRVDTFAGAMLAS